MIKLRLYDKINKRYLIPLSEGPYEDIDLTYADDKWYILGGERLTEDKYRLDLYTGMSDPLTGKELYENDKVTVHSHYEGDNWIDSFEGIVTMSDGEWAIINNNKYISLWEYVYNYH